MTTMDEEIMAPVVEQEPLPDWAWKAKPIYDHAMRWNRILRCMPHTPAVAMKLDVPEPDSSIEVSGMILLSGPARSAPWRILFRIEQTFESHSRLRFFGSENIQNVLLDPNNRWVVRGLIDAEVVGFFIGKSALRESLPKPHKNRQACASSKELATN